MFPLQIIELTGCAQEKAEIAMFDSKNDMDRAVNHVLEGGNDEVKILSWTDLDSIGQKFMGAFCSL